MIDLSSDTNIKELEQLILKYKRKEEFMSILNHYSIYNIKDIKNLKKLKIIKSFKQNLIHIIIQKKILFF